MKPYLRTEIKRRKRKERKKEKNLIFTNISLMVKCC